MGATGSWATRWRRQFGLARDPTSRPALVPLDLHRLRPRFPCAASAAVVARRRTRRCGGVALPRGTCCSRIAACRVGRRSCRSRRLLAAEGRRRSRSTCCPDARRRADWLKDAQARARRSAELQGRSWARRCLLAASRAEPVADPISATMAGRRDRGPGTRSCSRTGSRSGRLAGEAAAGSEGYAKAEVTLGGVDTRRPVVEDDGSARRFRASTRSARPSTSPGWLGGYNFQWAWSSGWVAGEAV
jgi:hypothetical protein